MHRAVFQLFGSDVGPKNCLGGSGRYRSLRLNDDKIYYELDKIHKNQISIENHLFRQTHGKNPNPLSSSTTI